VESVQQPAATTDIDQLAAQVRQIASSLQLVVVPAMPLHSSGTGLVVLLDDDDMSAADFCALASAADAKLLYLRAESFDAENEQELDIEENDRTEPGEKARAQLADLRRDAERFNGRIGQLEVAFAIGGVLHYWAAAAEWYDNLMDRVAELFPGEGLEVEHLSDAESQALVERLTGELAAMPAFRAASTAAQRQRVARAQNAEIAALYEDPRPGYRMTAVRALREATDIAEADAERIYREMESNLPELAAELAATPQYGNAGTAGARKQRARDFLIENTGGYPPTTRFFELFLDTSPIQKAKRI
jgi:hypothetical protein